jgi:predicted GTPase
MKYGAGTIGANKAGAREIVDPRPYTVGSITETFRKYPDIGALLPAMGYSPGQVSDLEETINRVDCDAVVIGTPIDLTREIIINKPYTRVRYEIKEIGELTLETVIDEFLLVVA